MSLINDMLRDLDAKRPDDPARQNLQREIRSLPRLRQGAGRWLRPMLLTVLPLVGMGAAALYSGGYWPQLVLNEPVTTPSLPAVPAEQPPVAVAPTSEQLALRASDALAVVPQAEPLLPAPDPVMPKSATPASPTLDVAKPTAVATPPSAVASQPVLPAAPAKIEKSLSLATPRDRAEAEFRRGEAALASGRAGEALEPLRAALKIDPSHVQARQLLLRQLLEQRKTSEVTVLLQEGLEVLPQQTGWAISLARLQLERGEAAAADQTLVRSQPFAENNADYAGFQGYLKTRLGDHRQAIPLYARATRIAPDEGRWWLGLGLALESDGRTQDAKEALRKALATGRLSPALAAEAEQHLR